MNGKDIADNTNDVWKKKRKWLYVLTSGCDLSFVYLVWGGATSRAGYSRSYPR